MIRGGDGHRVDVGLIEQVVVIGVGTGDFVAIGGFLEACGVDFGNGYRGGARTMENAVEMSEAETTGSNHRTTKSFVHNCWGTTCRLWLTCREACSRYVWPGQP